MECFLSFTVLVIVIVTVVAFASRAQSYADRWNRSYRALAERYGGAFLPAGWFSKPSVRFRYSLTHVLINTHSVGTNQYTQIFINWPDAGFRCEIFPDWGGTRPRPLRGMGDVSSGSREFDDRYVIRSNDAIEIRNFLSDGVRMQIDRLRHLLRSNDVYLSINRGQLVIKKPSLIHDFESLQDFAHLSLELFDQAMLTRSVGIQFVEQLSVQVVNDAKCQVCGYVITTDMVFCHRCKTPHHLECWQYAGNCSVYGCQESRFITPRLAGPAETDREADESHAT